ncbi:MAG: NAD(P)H-hydrate dehydratase, partial [Phycisphaeraceae bacterium]|nr:NAD(P)H-hydrate dehydratase [Phycisphaeraceae bacterium]
GLGRRRRAADIVREVTSGPRAMVLDADALNHLAAAPDHFRPGAPSVMTPHPGEFRRLAAPLNLDGDPTDEADRPRLAGELARAYGATVILKGRHSIVTDGDCVFTNRTGNPALATAGSGDVLTGAVAALMAQGLAPFDAAVLGAHLHGAAADLWRDAHGASGLTARDLADLLPDAFEAARCAS